MIDSLYLLEMVDVVICFMSFQRLYQPCLFLSEDCSLEENIKLKDALELDEKRAHESVKLLLRKYERLKVIFVIQVFVVVR